MLCTSHVVLSGPHVRYCAADELRVQHRQLDGIPLELWFKPLSELQCFLCAVREAEVQRRLAGIPPEIWDRLFPFQRAGVRQGVAHSGRCLLADEMGLGKTVQVSGQLGNKVKCSFTSI